MKIGLTYDLRDHYLKMGFSDEETAEFDRESTIDAIESAIKANGYDVERIGNIKDLVKALSNNKTWDIVFNICEGLYGRYSREAQVPALLEAYNIPYTFSDPLVMSISLKKDMAKKIVRSAGFKTPDFFVIKNIDDITKVKNIEYPLFIKPIAEGTSKGVNDKSKVNSYDELYTNSLYLLKKYKQPIIVETFCPGREFTAGIIGTGDECQYIGALEVILKQGAEKNAYTYQNKEKCEELIEYSLVTDDEINSKLSKLSTSIWKLLECRDAGRIDFMLDRDNELSFLEVNPLSGLHPTHSDLPILWTKIGKNYNDLIGFIINSVKKRIGL